MVLVIEHAVVILDVIAIDIVVTFERYFTAARVSKLRRMQL